MFLKGGFYPIKGAPFYVLSPIINIDFKKVGKTHVRSPLYFPLEFFFVFLGFALGGETALGGLLAVPLPIRISKFYIPCIESRIFICWHKKHFRSIKIHGILKHPNGYLFCRASLACSGGEMRIRVHRDQSCFTNSPLEVAGYRPI